MIKKFCYHKLLISVTQVIFLFPPSPPSPLLMSINRYSWSGLSIMYNNFLIVVYAHSLDEAITIAVNSITNGCVIADNRPNFREGDYIPPTSAYRTIDNVPIVEFIRTTHPSVSSVMVEFIQFN